MIVLSFICCNQDRLIINTPLNLKKYTRQNQFFNTDVVVVFLNLNYVRISIRWEILAQGFACSPSSLRDK